MLDLDNHANTGAFHQPTIAHAVLYTVKPGFVVQQPGGGAVLYARHDQVAPQPAAMYAPQYAQQYAPQYAQQPPVAMYAQGAMPVTMGQPVSVPYGQA